MGWGGDLRTCALKSAKYKIAKLFRAVFGRKNIERLKINAFTQSLKYSALFAIFFVAIHHHHHLRDIGAHHRYLTVQIKKRKPTLSATGDAPTLSVPSASPPVVLGGALQ